jgi:hypothetical protein
LIGCGNLLLLSDRPEKAKEYFEQACKAEKVAGKTLRLAVEGVAEAIRDESGNVAAADAFIMSLRENPSGAGETITNAGSPPWEELRIVAQQTTLSKLATAPLPPLEQERAAQEDIAVNSATPLQVTSGFEGSTPVYATVVSPTHVVVEITTLGFRDWFMFQVRGVAGKTVRIDITGAYKTVPDWAQKSWSINPVYCYASSLDSLAPFAAAPASDQVTQASNGSMLSDTRGQSWQYVSNVWNDDYTLSFVQHFDSDSVFVAMRVPRTPSYNEQYLRELASAPQAKVVEVGRSAKDRALLLTEIGGTDAGRPCILIYAGEHADEQDAGWVAQGAIEYLLSDEPEAADLRNRFTFIVIPMLDPDASAVGIHQSIISSFLPGRATPESIAYANWFQSWVNTGHRLDLVLDLHNIQSGEGPQVFCPLMEGAGPRGTASLALHRLIVKRFQDAGYGIQLQPQMRGWMPDRLGGWLSHYFGPLTIAYEVNSQAPECHLNLYQLKALGGIFSKSAAQFLTTSGGHTALVAVDGRRSERLEQWSSYSQHAIFENAIMSESAVLKNAAGGNAAEFAEQSIQ